MQEMPGKVKKLYNRPVKGNLYNSRAKDIRDLIVDRGNPVVFCMTASVARCKLPPGQPSWRVWTTRTREKPEKAQGGYDGHQ